MAGEIVPGDRIPLKYRPFCVSLFRQLFSRACGYGKGKAFTCLCQWCEDFGEQQFDLLEKLVQQLRGMLPAPLSVSTADLSTARNHVQLGGMAQHALKCLQDGCARNPRHCLHFCGSVRSPVDNPLRRVCVGCGPDNVHDADDCLACGQLEVIESKLTVAIDSIDPTNSGRSPLRSRFLAELADIFWSLRRYVNHLLRDCLLSVASYQTTAKMLPWQCTFRIDYGMKWLAKKKRETKTDGFAKTGISWFGCVVQMVVPADRRNPDFPWWLLGPNADSVAPGSIIVLNFVVFCDDAGQTSFHAWNCAVCCLRAIKDLSPGTTEVHYSQFYTCS